MSIQISGKELAVRTAAPLEDDLEEQAPEGREGGSGEGRGPTSRWEGSQGDSGDSGDETYGFSISMVVPPSTIQE